MIPFFAFFAELTLLGWVIVVLLLASLFGVTNRFSPYRDDWGLGDISLVLLIGFVALFHYYVMNIPFSWSVLTNAAIAYVVGVFVYPIFEWQVSIFELREKLENLRSKWGRKLSSDQKLAPMYKALRDAASTAGNMSETKTLARNMQEELVSVYRNLSLGLDWNEFERSGSFAPRVEQNKAVLAYWAGWWPFILLNRIFGDLLSWLCKLPGRLFRPIFNAMSASTMKGV